MSDDKKTPENSDEQLADEWAAALGEQEDGEVSDEDKAAADAWEAALADQEGELADDDDPTRFASEVNLDHILEVPLTISMEIGRTRISIRNLLQLNQGSVVELDRLAGEPMDVLVNGTLIAHGEVVVVNDKFGIRLTDVVSPVERIKNLS
jgi:flagellar motor switch protein FliN/FliY